MGQQRERLKSVRGGNSPLRRGLGLKDELALALLPALTVLGVLVLLEAVTRQRVLFASLASSAFLIYLDPRHGMNTVRTLSIAHLLAVTVGLLAAWALGHGHAAAAAAMVATVLLMLLLDALHPPAISTSLIFAFRTGAEDNVTLFVLAVGVLVVLVLLQRGALWLLHRGGGAD